MNRLVRVLVVLSFLVVPTAAMAQSTPAVTGGGEGPFVFGLNQPALYTDERGTAVFEISVTDVEREWEAPEEVFPPERGKEFVAIHFSITNLTDDATEISPFSMTLLDSLGYPTEQAWLGDMEGVWFESVPIGGNETIEGAVVFIMYSDLEPGVVMFQPEYNAWVLIYLGDADGQ